jgi:predicted nucleic acid-binding protein
MIFLDANFLISLFVENHDHNRQAIKIWKKSNMMIL